VLRAEVSINRKSRPLFFASGKATEALDRYLADRAERGFGTQRDSSFRGLEPHSPLFLSDSGAPFQIVGYHDNGQARSLCRGIHDAYRKIFRRIGIVGISALSVRRTVATRLWDRGAAEEQIGAILGIGDLNAVRELLPERNQPLAHVVRELV
jgi:integrase